MLVSDNPFSIATDFDRSAIAARARFHGSDTGPKDTWLWAYDSHWADPVNRLLALNGLRQWVYVMWDRWRIDQWNVLATPWDVELARRTQFPSFYDE